MATETLVTARRRARVPSPVAAALPLVALAAFALLLDAAPELPWEVGVAVAGLFATAAAARLTQRWLAVQHLRRVADQLILRGGRAATSPLVAWRALELTSEHQRRLMAREATRLVRELGPETLPGAVPLNRAVARRHRSALEELADMLEHEPAVDARGILLAKQLLTSPGSPLYDRDAAPDLAAHLRRVRLALRA